MSSIDSPGIFAALQNFAASSGLFDVVVGHEIIKSPAAPTGLTCAVQWMGHAPCSSGVNSISIRLEMWYRIYTSAFTEPQDSIDPRVMAAADSLFSAIIGNFTLARPEVRYVDVSGSEGEGMVARAGYITMDSKPMRTADIVVPIILNDIYDEVA